MAADPAASVNLAGLFADLNKAEQSGDFEKAHKICNKILAHEKSNLKAKHCKLVCKIQLGQFEDALKEVEKPSNADLRPLVIFEKAYCEYKLNQIEECLATLATVGEEFGHREKELQAQALYRLEQYAQCYGIYQELTKSAADGYEDERATNLSAALACLALQQDPAAQSLPKLSENTFEKLYNSACIYIGRKDYKRAIDKLRCSEDICRKTLDEEGSTEEEIEAELTLIHAQIAYAHQCMGNAMEALEIYNQVLKQKPTDAALISVINNNIVAINQDQNIFDSKKRMKSAAGELSNAKLLSLQKKRIFMNNAILHLQTGQNGACREQLDQFRRLYPAESSFRLLLVEIALLKKEKRVGEAKMLLQKSITSPGTDYADRLELILVLAQLLLEQNDVKSFAALLSEFDLLCQYIGVVSTVAGVQVNVNDKQSAVESLQSAIAWFKKNQPTSSKELAILYRECTKLMSELNQLEGAISMLEELRRLDPTNPRLIAQLIRAYSVVDVEKARQICRDMPLIEELIADVDIDSIEQVNWSGGSKYIKKTAKSAEATEKKADGKKTHKRKRKPRLPRYYDPNTKPDPERWLPKWQRSTYRKRKNDRKHNVGKGTQGAVGGADVTETTSSFKQSPRPVGSSPMQGLTRQQRAQKKKKGGRR